MTTNNLPGLYNIIIIETICKEPPLKWNTCILCGRYYQEEKENYAILDQVSNLKVK